MAAGITRPALHWCERISSERDQDGHNVYRSPCGAVVYVGTWFGERWHYRTTKPHTNYRSMVTCRRCLNQLKRTVA